jgi:thiosulfate/3-mercaptopyruvate sulfurtransferase
VRDIDEWLKGSSPYGRTSRRKGRLPGAKWIEWYRFMKPSAQGRCSSRRWKCRLAATAGIGRTTRYLYCFKGARASTLPGAEAGRFSDVRMYFGSWNEWSRDDACQSSRFQLMAAKKKPMLAMAA